MSGRSKSSELARARWRLLKTLLFSDAETQAKLLTRPSVISKRSHGQYQLFSVRHIEGAKKDGFNGSESKSGKEVQPSTEFSWLEYSVGEGKTLFEIRQTTPKLTLKDFFSQFSGFLNTGNICIWPAEEILAWYVYENQALFKGKSICELGGGMAALAGVVAAALCSPLKVVLTEGNPQCVTNLQEIIDENSPPHNTYFPVSAGKEPVVTSRQILWDTKATYQKEFDTILVADCLYAEEVHDSLLHVIKQSLLPNGRVYVMAPKRGPSFEGFKKKVEADEAFVAEVIPRYSDAVWAKHEQFLATDQHYNEDVHYPLLMILTWADEGPRAKRQKIEE